MKKGGFSLMYVRPRLHVHVHYWKGRGRPQRSTEDLQADESSCLLQSMPTEPEGLWRGSRAWQWHWQWANDGDYVPKEDWMGFKSTHLPHSHIFLIFFFWWGCGGTTWNVLFGRGFLQIHCVNFTNVISTCLDNVINFKLWWWLAEVNFHVVVTSVFPNIKWKEWHLPLTFVSVTGTGSVLQGLAGWSLSKDNLSTDKWTQLQAAFHPYWQVKPNSFVY